MHRWFDIASAENDLKFQPIVPYGEGWPDAIEWFKTHWLPGYVFNTSLFGIAKQSQAKIDIQEASRLKDAAKN